MAPRDPGRAHPSASKPAIPFDRFVGVVGTGRVVAAGGRKNFREGHLVATNQGQEEPGHELNFASLSAACSPSATRSPKATSSPAAPATRPPPQPIPPPPTPTT